ncbi:MAG: hypothetical protein ACERKZ_17495 [Lachnotalea sp.]
MKKYYTDYVSNFKVKDNKKEAEELEYSGDYYEFILSYNEYQKMRIIILLTVIITASIFILVGFLNNSGSFCIYVLLPYICILLPLTYLIRSYIRIPKEKKKMEYAIYDKCYIRVKFSLVGLITASLTTVIGNFIFIVRNVNHIIFMKEVSFCIANILIVILSILLLIYHNRIVCEKQ